MICLKNKIGYLIYSKMNNLTTNRMYVYSFYVDKKEINTTVF